jgi:hypothetical protein
VTSGLVSERREEAQIAALIEAAVLALEDR